MEFDRITINPAQMGGMPCIRRLRIPVATVVGMVAEGMPTDEILEAYPELTHEMVEAALQYAMMVIDEEKVLAHA